MTCWRRSQEEEGKKKNNIMVQSPNHQGHPISSRAPSYSGKMENSCGPSSLGQGPESSLPALPGRIQVLLFSPTGANGKLRAPMKGINCPALVSPPVEYSQLNGRHPTQRDSDLPPSARPPQENSVTVSPAGRRVSILMHP